MIAKIKNIMLRKWVFYAGAALPTLIMLLTFSIDVNGDSCDQWQLECFDWAIKGWGYLIIPLIIVQGAFFFAIEQVWRELQNDKIMAEKERNKACAEARDAEARILDLEESIEDAKKNSIDLFRGHLKTIFYEHNLGSDDRLSIYYKSGDRFVIISRYAKAKQYDGCGRTSYPANEGVISASWNSGKDIYFDDAPAPSNFKAYHSHVCKYGRISRDECLQLTMKSRTYGAFLIDDARGEPLCVVVAESTRPQRFERGGEFLSKSIHQHHAIQLREFITRNEHWLTQVRADEEVEA